MKCRKFSAKFIYGRNRHQHLGTVWDDALENTGKRIQDRRCFSRRDAVLLCHFFCDRICHDDRHCIVCRGNVHRTDQQSHAELTAAFTTENPVDPAKQSIKSAIFTDQGTHCRHLFGNHAGFKHSGNAIPHVCKKIDRCDMPSGQHDKRPGNNPDQKHHKDINADNASDQH